MANYHFMSIALKGLQSLGMPSVAQRNGIKDSGPPGCSGLTFSASKDFKERLLFSRGFFCQFDKRFYLSLRLTPLQLLFTETGTGKLEKVFFYPRNSYAMVQCILLSLYGRGPNLLV